MTSPAPDHEPQAPHAPGAACSPGQRESSGRLPLTRPAQSPIAGVCAGLALHLGVEVAVVRWVMAGLTLAAGAGPLLYLWLWLTVPAGDPRDLAARSRPPLLTRLAPSLVDSSRARPRTDVLLAGALLLAAAVLVLGRLAGSETPGWLLPALVVVAGAALAWSTLGTDLGHVPAKRSTVASRVGGGIALVLVGAVLLLGQDQRPDVVFRSLAGGLALLAGVAIVLAPLLVRLLGQLRAERDARTREAERADIAAHLHDSVLQTLALIRGAADDPERVARLARSQERELRSWLYSDRAAPGESVAEALRAVVAEVEDLHGGLPDVVTVGDCRPWTGAQPLLDAAREAVVNAVRHGRPPVTVYAEITDAAAEVFVRDRGPGFDPERVAPERLGVRESIIGRMRRHGGSAEVRSSNAGGAEVRLRMPRNGQEER